MEVTVVDPFISSPTHKHLKNWKEGNLRSAKVVVAALGLNKTSEQIFDDEFFSQAHESLLFINGARGKLVSEKALKEFLLSHPESFAFLDVFQNEPFGEDWHGFPQVWKTSHIAGVEKDLDQKILGFTEEVLKNYLSIDESSFKERYKNELLQNKWKEGVLI